MDEKSGGISFAGLLTLLFITLKLIGVIKWSWLWVLSPIWIPLAVAILFIVWILIRSGKKNTKEKDNGK